MSEGEGDEYIIEEMQAGYMLGGRVVRHSLVKVGPKTI
jgi:molecular chaperone GrpE (heat shock protein)